jgi:hypothetical protein
MKRLIIILLLVLLSYGTALAGEFVALQSVQNGKYVRDGVGSESYLAATSSHIKGWETFDITYISPGKIVLQSVQNHKLVRAGIGKYSKLAANSSGLVPEGWEVFYFIHLSGNKIALKSVQNDKYVRAGVGSESYLAATSSHIRGWETFRLVEVDAASVGINYDCYRYAFQSSAFGRWFHNHKCSDPGSGGRWSTDYNVHYQWCVKVSTYKANQSTEEKKKWLREYCEYRL